MYTLPPKVGICEH